ncbi:helix-turn-helix domain-containing protein [Streptomyces sp. SP18CS02]|uniref:AraC-like ligand-binding domain-containing protein n=1 Tax=Streptomyces sp. SP18CS02 TaxID=3002531 RepID=UPI002E77002E|nr:helix-turn-helix domain-containing protein [Streptomyces sp. SP18CS02]MEE1757275.1 helix-turn-helix domain-containing protein [Streptomyces sp. SP18CS02]
MRLEARVPAVELTGPAGRPARTADPKDPVHLAGPPQGTLHPPGPDPSTLPVLDIPDTTGPAFVEVFDIQEAHPARRLRAWGDLVHLACGPLRVVPGSDEGFNGLIVSGKFGAVQVALIDADPHAVECTEHLIRCADWTPLYLCCVIAGEVRVDQDGQETSARTGDLIAFDSSRPFTLTMRQPIRMVTVKFEHRLLGLVPGEEHPLKAAAWSGQHGIGMLLAHFLAGLADHMTDLNTANADRLGDSVASLISAMCSDSLRGAVAPPAVARRALLQRVQAYAREHLGDPALSPARLARQHNMSLRYLQMLFQEENASPARWIRNERLDRCRDDLGNPRFSHLAVANIAERWGLPGASHFSRLFRERYHVTPREWRRQRTQRDS